MCRISEALFTYACRPIQRRMHACYYLVMYVPTSSLVNTLKCAACMGGCNRILYMHTCGTPCSPARRNGYALGAYAHTPEMWGCQSMSRCRYKANLQATVPPRRTQMSFSCSKSSISQDILPAFLALHARDLSNHEARTRAVLVAPWQKRFWCHCSPHASFIMFH